jgi:serine protease
MSLGMANLPSAHAQKAWKPSIGSPHSVQVNKPALPTNRIIVKYRTTTSAFTNPKRVGQMERVNSVAGMNLKYLREMSDDANVLVLPERLPLEQVQAISELLMTLPEVEYAEPDRILTPVLTPNDPYYPINQWHYYDTWGINATSAWDITTGSSSIVMAVIDTGITNHADMSGRTVPGYDFISDTWTANDGNGRDSNPSDPGDWVSRLVIRLPQRTARGMVRSLQVNRCDWQ